MYFSIIIRLNNDSFENAGDLSFDESHVKRENSLSPRSISNENIFASLEVGNGENSVENVDYQNVDHASGWKIVDVFTKRENEEAEDPLHTEGHEEEIIAIPFDPFEQDQLPDMCTTVPNSPEYVSVETYDEMDNKEDVREPHKKKLGAQIARTPHSYTTNEINDEIDVCTTKKMDKFLDKFELSPNESTKSFTKDGDDQKKEKKTTTKNQKKKTFVCKQCKKRFAEKRNLKAHLSIHSDYRPHQCDQCPEKFRTKHQFKSHMRLHTAPKVHICEICEKHFKSKSQLNIHTRLHTGERPYACDYCSKRFISSGDYAQHVRIHTGERPYRCDFCNKGFIQLSNMKTHLRVHTTDRPHQCHLCERKFFRRTELRSHLLVHTGGREKLFSCDSCQKKFTTKLSLDKHQIIKHQSHLFYCAGCFRGFDQISEKDAHEKNCGCRRYECYLCNRNENKKPFVTSAKYKIEIHFRIHTGNRPFSCNYCPKRFIQKIDLVNHERVHAREKVHKCNFCEKIFSNQGKLTQHTRTHTGEQLHQCHRCPKRFTIKFHLRSHMRTHEPNLFYCLGCFRAFSRNSEKKAHEKECQRRRYECYLCNRNEEKKPPLAFNLRTLQNHLKIHTGEKPHRCEYCENRFRSSAQLKMHVRIHTGDMPYQCQHCEKQFSAKSKFTAHLRVHTGERPFPCTVCPKKFTNSSNLKVHMDRMHY